MKTDDKIRPSQLIYQSGPGAILDLLDSSVMVLSAEKWNTYNAPKEDDKRITSMLKVNHVRILNENSDRQKIKVTPFPKWKICPKCGRMTQFNNSNCYFCKQKGSDYTLYPSRFVTVCNKGHISDFPYEKWVHKNKSCSHYSEEPRLILFKKGTSGSLSDLAVKCLHCNVIESLGTIMKPEEMESSIFKCTGEMPWREITSSECNNQTRTFLRGASNVYSPSVVSFLQVPLTSGASENDILFLIDGKQEQLKMMYQSMGEDGLKAACDLLRIDQQFIPTIKKYLDDELKLDEVTSYESIRKQEWNTLIQGNIVDSYINFKVEKVEMHEKLNPYFESIHRVDSVPEVQVLRGFSRVEYVDRFEDNFMHKPLTSHEDWLPAVRNYGEGIFIKFNLSKLIEWEKEQNITSKIIEFYNSQREEMDSVPMDILPRHLLIHSFSHALLKEFAAYSGYTTTSLKERLYTGGNMYGLLIYTAAGDSEGSLGGLTNLADKNKLYPIIIRSVEKMEHCSSDPHCSDGDFKYYSTANGAACHACAFVSETSCEWGNQLLDRRLLLNINPNQTFGYFDNLLNK